MAISHQNSFQCKNRLYIDSSLQPLYYPRYLDKIAFVIKTAFFQIHLFLEITILFSYRKSNLLFRDSKKPFPVVVFFETIKVKRMTIIFDDETVVKQTFVWTKMEVRKLQI